MIAWMYSLTAENLPRISDPQDNMLPSLPSDQQTELWLVGVLAFLQKWAFFVCIVLVIIFVLNAAISKARKNPKLVRFWKFLAYGVGLIGIVFALLPYFVLGELNK